MATEDRGLAGEVLPLENTAFFDVDTRDEYVRIEQSWGDKTLYTPEEAEDIADAIAAAAEDASRRDG
ncbi:hypothetical protein BRC92_08895 [Halobacteriales archaeon QS_4_69_31]|nr:MAG: hypothetical protein BRC92_08895 [Halobacteriales archaeon QS_4_69_31]